MTSLAEWPIENILRSILSNSNRPIKQDGQLTIAITTQRSSHPSCVRRHRYANRRMTRIKATAVRDIERTIIVGPQLGMGAAAALATTISVKCSMIENLSSR
jgi:hypothetical protein